MSIRIPIKNILQIQERLAEIRGAMGDVEQAYGLEGELWHDVLVSIAAGAYRPRQLAAAALESQAIVFHRSGA